MNTLEIIVLVFAILTIVKAITLMFIKQKPILKLVEKMTQFSGLHGMVIGLGILAFTYLLMQYISITQIFAGVILGTGMMGLFFIQYPKLMNSMVKEMMKNKRGLFIGFFFFIVLSIWVIIDLLL